MRATAAIDPEHELCAQACSIRHPGGRWRTRLRHTDNEVGLAGDITVNVTTLPGDIGTESVADNACGALVSLTDVSRRWDIASVPNATGGVDIGAFEYQGSPETDTSILTFDCL